MTMSAQRRADRALPVVAQELVAARADNQRLRDIIQALQSGSSEMPMLRQIIHSLQSTNYQLHNQAGSLYSQMSTLQQQARAFSQQRQVLQTQLGNSLATLDELTDLVIRLQCVIRNIDPDIFVTFPANVQALLADIHEEWKWQEYCRMMTEEETGCTRQSCGSSTTQTQNSHQEGQTEGQASSSSGSTNVTSNESANATSTSSDDQASDDNTSASSSNRNIASTAGPSTERAISWNDTFGDYLDDDFLNHMFRGHTPIAPRSRRRQEPLTPDSPSSIGTPRTIYSSAASETVQQAQTGQGSQTSEAVQDAVEDAVQDAVEDAVEDAVQDAESSETVEDITAFNAINSHNTVTTPKQ
ncbi:hypothetical protein CTA2_9655 [Colletotrichum tanaceti]|nr:hypothetical protein CTA2_9655 [Colletotrichum tanaceti]